MKYPKFLKTGNTIGVCAPSFGVPYDPYRIRYDQSKIYLNNLGYKIKETKSVYKLVKDESAPKEIRAQEFMDLYFDNEVNFIMSVAGGEMMCQILPYIDFNKIKKFPPKFFMGYSDNTVLTYTLTTMCDIATIYGPCAGDFGARTLDKSFKNCLKIIKGDLIKQNSFAKYERESLKYEDYLAPLNKTKTVRWHANKDKIHMEGRLLGGCLDVLVMLLGTKYDNTKEFIEKYREDGILWYLESCDLNSLCVKRTLFQLKEAGWFKYVKGFIFGRPNNSETPFDVSYYDAVNDILNELNVPIIFDADFGHVHPSFTIINGSFGKIDYENHKGSIEQILK